MESVVEFTNGYAVSRIGNYTSYDDRHGALVGTSVEEMYSFIGLLSFMSIVHLPKLERYWSIATLYHGLWARRVIPSRNRWQETIFLSDGHLFYLSTDVSQCMVK